VPFFVLLGDTLPTKRMTTAAFGKMPTTSMRRLTSLFKRSPNYGLSGTRRLWVDVTDPSPTDHSDGVVPSEAFGLKPLK
jgi:hypothetical protein